MLSIFWRFGARPACAVLWLASAASCGRVGIERLRAEGSVPGPDARVSDGSLFDGPIVDAPAATCPSGLLAEWRADGTFANEVPCSPLVARPVGSVAYGDGNTGQAWHFRSTWTGDPPGGDPDYVALDVAAPVRFDEVTIDAWVRLTSFNDYPNSDRFVFSSGGAMTGSAGTVWLYLHENRSLYFYVTAGTGSRQDRDWAVCHLSSWGETLPFDRWLRLTATYDGTTLRCYADGAPFSETPLARRAPAADVAAPVIGRNFPGDVDALRLFDRALRADEIAQPWP